jgi:hypothetical protein
MSEQIRSSPHSFVDANHGLHTSVAPETAPAPNAADRMYQLAALTAGLFLLVTLL